MSTKVKPIQHDNVLRIDIVQTNGKNVRYVPASKTVFEYPDYFLFEIEDKKNEVSIWYNRSHAREIKIVKSKKEL
jgi:hypothetical protein